MSTDEIVNAVIPQLVTAIKEKAYVNGYKATDAEALGLVVSKFCKWDRGDILNVACEALEDSNFHDDVATIESKLFMKEQS
tara:strand:+ start:212 stop:454 length:243 start_codon:yes stop_codon:yes gene_type:complete